MLNVRCWMLIGLFPLSTQTEIQYLKYKQLVFFADHLSSVYNSPLERAPLVNVVNHISKIVITEDMILQLLEFLDGSKSPGPNGIHSNLLKRFSKDFAIILFYIFNKNLESGILPSDWKSGEYSTNS